MNAQRLKNHLVYQVRRVVGVALIFLGSTATSHGSNVRVQAMLDTNQIRIGEQFHINLSAIVSSGERISFPVIPDTMNGLDVVQRSGIDTAKQPNGTAITLKQQLTFTGFDSGFYVIEPFQFLVTASDGKTDTISTEAQLISIKTIPVDTTKAFKDIKPVMDPPFDWREWLPYIIGLFVLLIFAIAGYLIYRKIKNKPVLPQIIQRPARPDHEIALEALDQLEREKLWQQGNYKEYHIRLSDIVRTYIEARYGVSSLESTTDETLSGLRKHAIATENTQSLETILRLADLVKFAKAIPIVTENEQSMADARKFIAATLSTITEKETSS